MGTPLYQTPQVLAQVYYNETVDTWALGTILYELVFGVTPFNCLSEEELISKLKHGRFTVSSESEPIYIETCLFLLDCLQIHEQDRLRPDSLLCSPFINDEFAAFALHELDHAAFQQDLKAESARLEDMNSSRASLLDFDYQ